MKYPKVLQVLAVATAISLAAPGALVSTRASGEAETAETPQEYAARTGYVLPAGFHYVLNGEFIILDEQGNPVLEADSAPAVPEIPSEDAGADGGQGGTGETGGDQGGTGETGGNQGGTGETGEDQGETGDAGEDQGETGGNQGGTGETGEDQDETGDAGEDQGETGESGSQDGSEETGDSGSQDGNDGNLNPDGGQAAKPETPVAPGAAAPGEVQASVEEAKSQGQREEEPFYMTSAQFRALHERIQYNVDVPIEGLPSFITQEMVVGALKAQDETGYPASVTIAQIIQESGYGKYGPGGEDGKGLSYLAFEYCNLFGIKGIGTKGSVSMKTSEMEDDGSTYSTYAGFRVYNTYTECIEDRSKLLEEVYSDLTENVTDANTFAMKIGKRWATDLQYGKHLINTMRRYDLYRLDDMTLNDFDALIGEFANPCPGSTITSLFGRRTAPIAGATTYHRGLDMGTGAYNIPTYAAKAGTVVFAGEAGACGNLITIDHGDGLVTKYMHHAEIYVKEGDTVEKGQQIGLSGTTGNSTGNHLHFQVEENGTAVDPLEYLQASAEEAEAAKEAYTIKQAKAVKDAKEAKLTQVKALMRDVMAMKN